MSYLNLIDELARHGRPKGHYDLSCTYAVDTIEHPDYDIPGVLAVSPTGRVMLVVEGERHLVGPIIEAARAAVAAIEKDTA